MMHILRGMVANRVNGKSEVQAGLVRHLWSARVCSVTYQFLQRVCDCGNIAIR